MPQSKLLPLTLIISMAALILLMFGFNQNTYSANLDILTEKEKQIVFHRMQELEIEQGMELFRKSQSKESELKNKTQTNQEIVKKNNSHQSTPNTNKNNNLQSNNPIKKEVQIPDSTPVNLSVTHQTKTKQPALNHIKSAANEQQVSEIDSNLNSNQPNLKELIRLVFAQSEEIQIAKEKQKQNNLNAKVLESTFLPNINASLAINQSKSNSASLAKNSIASLEFTQKIWQPLSNDVSDEKAVITRQIAKFSYFKTESDLIFKAMAAFFEVLKAQYSIEYAKQTLKGAKDTFKTAQILFDSGQTSALELLRSQSALEVTKANLLSAEQNFTKGLATLGNLVGSEVSGISATGVNLLETLADEFVESEENEWLDYVGQNNAALKIAFYNFKLASLNAKSEEKKYAPELQLRANTSQYLHDSNNSNRKNSTSIGLNFSIPIYQAGNQENRLETSLSLLKEGQLNYDFLKKELKYQLIELKQKQSYLNQLMVAYKSAEQSLKSQLEKTTEAFRSGVIEVNEVNKATSEYAGAKLNTQITKLDKIINFITINHLLGTLNEQRVINLLSAR